VTSAIGAYWTPSSLTAGTATATVTVDDTQTKQTWEGMGGVFNEAGWNMLSQLSQTDRNTAMHLLYGSDGARFNLGRIPMGANDYALTRYTEDETNGDTTLGSFSITRDMMYLIPYAKAALALNPSVRFWANPWTPPTWMKTTAGSVNGNTCALTGSTAFDGGCMNGSTANLSAYAQYFLKFVQAYAQQGIAIDTVAPQQQPTYSEGYPSCLWSASDYTKFVGQYLGPALASTNTKIMLGTLLNSDSGKDTTFVTGVMGDASAKPFIKTIGLSWSMLDNYESNPPAYDVYGLPIWVTEHKAGNYPWMTSAGSAGSCGIIACPAYVSSAAPNDQSYGVESWGYISKAIRAGVTAYNAWNMVLDTVGKGNDTTRAWAQDALLTVSTSKALGITPAYYVFRHVSQFVQVGAKVVAASGGDSIAFKNPDGSIVTVMYNSGAAATYTVAVGGQKYQFAMPANGWATLDYVPGS
jgi:glucosylceramidase